VVSASFILQSNPGVAQVSTEAVELSEDEVSTEVEWMTIEEALEKMTIEKKKILVNVYTDWCRWCRHMDKTTFEKEQIIQYINETYYPVKFDAEQKTPIKIGNKTYKYVKGDGKNRGYHELAMDITMGRLTYPSVVFIDENVRVLQPFPGFKDPNTFEVIMTYYGHDHYKKVPWSKYQQSYIPIRKPKPQLISD